MIQLPRWLGKLAALFLLLGIVLSPLRAAAAIPMLIAYDAAVLPTATTRIGGHDAIRREAEHHSNNTYDPDRRSYDNALNPRVAARAGARAIHGVAAVTAAAEGVEAAGASRAMAPYWPANNGFLGSTTSTTLEAGTTIDRFGGSPFSRFFSPAGTPLAARAVPAETAAMPLRTFNVLQPFTVESGTVAPAFGQLGMGTQFRTSLTLGELLEQGFLEAAH